MLRKLLVLISIFLAFRGSALAVEIVLSCGATGTEFKDCLTSARLWSEKSRHRVKVVSAPANVSERLGLYQMLLASRSPDVDVFPLDVIWPGVIGNHFIDLLPHTNKIDLSQHFAAYIDNNTVDGRLLSLPAFIDAGLLYYRKDLLNKYGEKVPTSWLELEATAKRIQAAENRSRGRTHPLWGYVFQGRAYEGLTCNALEWISSFGGGELVNEKGEITINNPRAESALRAAQDWMGQITPTGVLNYTEEESRGLFQTGSAIFMRNWPYAWGLSQSKDSPVRGRVGVTMLPHGPEGRSVAVFGGSSFGVSKYSRHPREAAQFVLFLTGRAEQKRRAIQSSFNPTMPSLYDDPQILAAQPFMKELLPTFEAALSRPAKITKTQYNRVSAEFWEAVHSVLAKKKDPKQALFELERRLQRVRRGGRW